MKAICPHDFISFENTKSKNTQFWTSFFLKENKTKIILPSRGWNKTCGGKPNFLKMEHHQPCCHPNSPSPCSHPNVSITTLPSPSSECCCHNAVAPMLLSQCCHPNVAIPMLPFPSSYFLPGAAIRHLYTAFPFPMLHNAALPMQPSECSCPNAAVLMVAMIPKQHSISYITKLL